MYVPELYRPEDPSWVAGIVSAHPFATLISNGDPVPFATHLPTVLLPADGGTSAGPDPLAGRVFACHLNRANPHWARLAQERNALLVFRGPGNYISPTWYRTAPAAPTWNFISVHARGTVEPIEDPEETLEVIRATVDALEQSQGASWSAEGSQEYWRTLLPGVGAFRLHVTESDAMFKLSQEKSPAVREQVMAGLGESGSPSGPGVASCMRAYVND